MRFLTLLHIATTAHAVSLASFTPRIDSLPAQCETVYRQKISDCTGADFAQPDKVPCSDACVAGLQTIGVAVKEQCAGVDVAANSIVRQFLIGVGVQALCPAVKPSTMSSVKSVEATSTSVPSSLTTRTATTTISASVSSSAPSSTGLDTDPVATTTFTTSTLLAPTSSVATAIATLSGQLSNMNSGGGSPFDVVAMGASSRLCTMDKAAAALFVTALLFVVYL